MKKFLLLLIAVLCLLAVSASGSVTSPAKAAVTQCNDQLDNDGDGKRDYVYNGFGGSDPGCSNWDDPDETDLPQCSDTLDNDGDGKYDYYNILGGDPDCENAADNSEAGSGGTPLPQCNNNFDDDGDGLIDYYQDPSCGGSPNGSEFSAPPPPPSGAACGNGLDDDGDSKVDYPADPGCYSSADTDEGNVAQCADGVDNDADGKVDTGNVYNWNNNSYFPADDGCSAPWDDTEYQNAPAPPASANLQDVNGASGSDTDGVSNAVVIIPLPPDLPDAVTCRLVKLTRFEGNYRVTAQGLERYRNPTHVRARVIFQCNKLVSTGTMNICLQMRGFAGYSNKACFLQALSGNGMNFTFGADGWLQSTWWWDVPRLACQTPPVNGPIQDWRVNVTVTANGVLGAGPWSVSSASSVSPVNTEYCYKS